MCEFIANLLSKNVSTLNKEHTGIINSHCFGGFPSQTIIIYLSVSQTFSTVSLYEGLNFLRPTLENIRHENQSVLKLIFLLPQGWEHFFV